MSRTLDVKQFFRFCGPLVGVLTEFFGMRLIAGNEQHGARGNGFDVIERIEVHEFHVAAQRGVRRGQRGCALGGEFSTRRAVKLVKFPLNSPRKADQRPGRRIPVRHFGSVKIGALFFYRAHLGAMQNRLENTVTTLSILAENLAENLQATESQISDVDVVGEITEFVRSRILAQASAAMLAQANTLPRMLAGVLDR